MSKWDQGLDGKSVYSVCSLRVSFKIDLSCSELRRLYSTKIKKVYTHKQRKNEEDMEGAHERNFQNSKFISQILIVKLRHHSLLIPSPFRKGGRMKYTYFLVYFSESFFKWCQVLLSSTFIHIQIHMPILYLVKLQNQFYLLNLKSTKSYRNSSYVFIYVFDLLAMSVTVVS